MEAEMSVDDTGQGHGTRTGGQGTRGSGPRVLVAGASVAGPALAHWLRRRGAEVTVAERTPELRPGGQAVDARGVARDVIGRMGLTAAVRAACTDTAGAHTVDAEGKVLETFRADDDGGDGFIADIEILRGDLSQVLYDDTRDGVEYVFGERITGLVQDADGVDVVFAGGSRRALRLGGRRGRARTRSCGRWSSGRTSGFSATSGTCWPSTACPTSSGWTAGCSNTRTRSPDAPSSCGPSRTPPGRWP
ncbi:FAD-dependent monooxygenase [Yinghuangia aomiensis]